MARHRLADLSIAGPDGRRALDRATWTERDPRSTVRLTVGGAGTYAIGVATAPGTIHLDGAAFDRYLGEESVQPILDRRRAQGRLGTPARESYAKSAKTLLAVTDARGHLVRGPASPGLQPFGHDAEIVALADPYALGVGGTLPFQARLAGRPLAAWTVVAGGTIGTSTEAIPTQTIATDGAGRGEIRLTHDGHWFIRFVHMREGTPAERVDYVSRWATLTFGVPPAGVR